LERQLGCRWVNAALVRVNLLQQPVMLSVLELVPAEPFDLPSWKELQFHSSMFSHAS
jgi:hypothetical protein